MAIIAFAASFLIPVAGIVLGVLALRETARTGEPGRGLARAGLVIGVVYSVLQVGFFIVWLSLVVTLFVQHAGTAL